MRRLLVHVLAVILFAIFAIGVPASVRADCDVCGSCVATKASEKAPCSQGQLDCQLGQSCASPAQKLLMQAGIGVARTPSEAAFGDVTVAAVKPADIPPETAPPRA